MYWSIRCGTVWLTNGFPEWDRKEKRMRLTRAKAYLAASQMLEKLPYPGLRVVRIPEPKKRVIEGFTVKTGPSLNNPAIASSEAGPMFGPDEFDHWLRENGATLDRGQSKRVRVTLEVFEP